MGVVLVAGKQGKKVGKWRVWRAAEKARMASQEVSRVRSRRMAMQLVADTGSKCL